MKELVNKINEHRLFKGNLKKIEGTDILNRNFNDINTLVNALNSYFEKLPGFELKERITIENENRIVLYKGININRTGEVEVMNTFVIYNTATNRFLRCGELLGEDEDDEYVCFQYIFDGLNPTPTNRPRNIRQYKYVGKLTLTNPYKMGTNFLEYVKSLKNDFTTLYNFFDIEKWEEKSQ